MMKLEGGLGCSGRTERRIHYRMEERRVQLGLLEGISLVLDRESCEIRTRHCEQSGRNGGK